MNVWLKRGLQVGLFTGGLWLVGTGIASADTTHPAPHHRAGPLAHVTVDAPVDVSGNSVAVLGHSRTVDTQERPATAVSSGRGRSAVAAVPVHAPVDVQHNSVAVLGRAHPARSGHGSASANSGSGANHGSSPTAASRRSALVAAPVSAPVTVCGNSVGVLGRGTAGCSTGPDPATGQGTGAVRVPVTAPTTVCGNSAGVLGRSSASCGGARPAATATSARRNTVGVPVNAPVTVCANTVGRADASCRTGAGASGGTDPTSSGPPALVDVPVSAPVTACGNGVGLFGAATASCDGDPAASGDTPPGGTPPGETPPGATTGTPGDGGGTAAGHAGQLVRVGHVFTAGDVAGDATVAAAGRYRLADEAARNPAALASTGLDALVLVGAALLMLLAGLGLAFGVRRRTG